MSRDLQSETIGLKLAFRALGTSRKFDDGETYRLATEFEADPEAVRATKKLISAKDLRDVTKAKGNITRIWRERTLAYPSVDGTTLPGLRLCWKNMLVDTVDGIEAEFENFYAAVRAFDYVYRNELLPAAPRRLGDLYRAEYFPAEVVDEFGVSLTTLQVTPPDLSELSPGLYRREMERVRAEFQIASDLARQAFASELQQITEHLAERLTPDVEGNRKIFRDDTLGKVTSFFDRFRQLDVGDDETLTSLVDDARRLVQGVRPDHLRNNKAIAEIVRDGMSQVSRQVSDMLVDAPRRRLELPTRETA
jgi:Asp-tRNA(Asn)/Glu-tRNA(Gln) amidotransferase C subunit